MQTLCAQTDLLRLTTLRSLRSVLLARRTPGRCFLCSLSPLEPSPFALFVTASNHYKTNVRILLVLLLAKPAHLTCHIPVFFITFPTVPKLDSLQASYMTTTIATSHQILGEK